MGTQNAKYLAIAAGTVWLIPIAIVFGSYLSDLADRPRPAAAAQTWSSLPLPTEVYHVRVYEDGAAGSPIVENSYANLSDARLAFNNATMEERPGKPALWGIIKRAKITPEPNAYETHWYRQDQPSAGGQKGP